MNAFDDRVLDYEFWLTRRYLQAKLSGPTRLTVKDIVRLYKETGCLIYQSEDESFPTFQEWRKRNE